MSIYSYSIDIVPLSNEHMQSIREILVDCIIEFSLLTDDSVQEIEKKVNDADELNDPSYHYPNGVFLVVLDNNIVMGMGALRKLDTTTAELKRIFFTTSARNKEYGTQLLRSLIAYAKDRGYTAIRLQVYNPTTQQHAINFYKKFGFYEIPSYKDQENHYSMEKLLYL